MRWTGRLAAMALCAFPAIAPAQPVFFDDFDGDKLLPHWEQPRPSHWEHSVGGGMLHVTDLFFPSTPHTGGNYAAIGAFYEPQTDFRMDVWMGWEKAPVSGDQLFVSVFSPLGGGIMAQFGLMFLGGPPEFAATSGASAVRAELPEPGIHRLTIARTGSQFDYYLDGEHFASLSDPFAIPAGGVSLDFARPFPGEMNPYHVDRVRVIPAPPVLLVPIVVVPWMRRRSR